MRAKYFKHVQPIAAVAESKVAVASIKDECAHNEDDIIDLIEKLLAIDSNNYEYNLCMADICEELGRCANAKV